MSKPKIEPWAWVWRNGFAPLLTTDALKALEAGLEQDDSRIIQQAKNILLEGDYVRPEIF